MDHQISIDDLIKNIAKEDGLETPPDGFLNKVMSSVTAANEKPIVYKPLISKYVLAAIFFGVVLIVVFIFGSGYQSKGNYPYLENLLNDIQTFHFNLKIPAHISYIVSSALIMLMIQAVLISGLYKKMHR
jgi:hypothetical protein